MGSSSRDGVKKMEDESNGMEGSGNTTVPPSSCPPLPSMGEERTRRASEMIQGTQFVWCESCDDLSSALYQVENGNFDETPNENFHQPLTKSAETYEKVIQGAKSIRMLLFDDVDEIAYAEYEAAMRDFIKSTNPKRWSEVERQMDKSCAPAVGMRLKKENSDVQWQLAKHLALKEIHKTRSNLFTISAAMRNIFYWQQRVKSCIEDLTAGAATGQIEPDSAQVEGERECDLDLFLGGSCNPTTWRKDTAIPLCEEWGISYYNPQVDDWSEELVQIEAHAKENAKALLFVIDNQTRAITSCLEATEFICVGRVVSLVVSPDIAAASSIDGEPVRPRELKDLNRARRYLCDVAHRHGVEVHKDVRSAMSNIKGWFTEDSMEKMLFGAQAETTAMMPK